MERSHRLNPRPDGATSPPAAPSRTSGGCAIRSTASRLFSVTTCFIATFEHTTALAGSLNRPLRIEYASPGPARDRLADPAPRTPTLARGAPANAPSPGRRGHTGLAIHQPFVRNPRKTVRPRRRCCTGFPYPASPRHVDPKRLPCRAGANAQRPSVIRPYPEQIGRSLERRLPCLAPVARRLACRKRFRTAVRLSWEVSARAPPSAFGDY